MIDLVGIAQRWPKVPLGELCDIRGGYPAPQAEAAYEPDGIPFVRMKDVGRHHFTRSLSGTDQSLSKSQFTNGRYKLTPSGSILIPRSGSVGLNHRAILTTDAVIVSHLCALIPRSTRVTTEFLYRFLCVTDMRKLTKKTTGLDSIAFSDLRMVAVPVPPIAEQERVVEMLDRVEALLAKRRATIEDLNGLTRSIFMQLLGNGRFELAALGELAALKRGPFGGALKKEIFVEHGYKVYEQRNAIQDDFLIGRYFISESKFREMKDFAVLPDDLIVSCSGTLGRVAIVPESAQPGVINQALLRIRTDGGKVTPTYLKHALQSAGTQDKLSGMSHGTGLHNFPPMSEVRALSIPLPSLTSQRDFANQVAVVDRLRNAYRASFAGIEALFAVLENRAFRGEL